MTDMLIAYWGDVRDVEALIVSEDTVGPTVYTRIGNALQEFICAGYVTEILEYIPNYRYGTHGDTDRYVERWRMHLHTLGYELATSGVTEDYEPPSW